MISRMPIGVSSVDLVESQRQRDADSAAKTAEADEEVVADVEHGAQAARHREEHVVDEDTQEEDEDEDGDGGVEDVS